MVRLSVLVFFLTLINSACGYHFGAVKRNIPGAYDRVSVPVFKNSTPEVGIETFFTKAMIEEIERGHIATVTSKEEAQVIIEGEIVQIEYAQGAALNRDDGSLPNLPRDAVLAKKYTIFVTARVKVRRQSDQKIVWAGDFKGERPYPAPIVSRAVFNTVNPLYNHSARYDNIRTISKDMMSEAYTRMTENF